MLCLGHLRFGRQRTGVLPGPASLDQQGEKKNHVGREDCEENFLETFAPIDLGVTGQGDGNRKWICHVQCIFPEPMPSAPYARSA